MITLKDTIEIKGSSKEVSNMENLKIKHFWYNTFIIQNDKTKIAIDPGKNLFWTKLNSLIPRSEWKGVTHVLVTHGDFDHFAYAVSMAKETGAKVVCGEGLEEDFLSDGIEDVQKIDVGGVVDLEDLKVEGLKTRHGPLPAKLGYGLMEMNNALLERSHGGQEVFLGPIRLYVVSVYGTT